MISKTGVVAVVLCFLAICQWRAFVNAKAMQCLDQYEILQNHTMCIADPSQKLNDSERYEIETKSNAIRNTVQPAAYKMMEIAYSTAVEREAQTWADTCKLEHDDPYYRFTPGRYFVGQNLYVGTNISWSDVIDVWSRENNTFQYNKTGNDIASVGNYTQMVFEDTVLVGCGKQKCGSLYFYVCNFAPGITDAQLDTPYVAGNSGDGCHTHYSNVTSTSSLCSCVGKFCINGGTLDLNTCTCQCVQGVQDYDSHICELNCTVGGDHTDCKHMSESDCRTDVMVPFKCPWLCKICPYSGKNYIQNSVRMPWDTTTIPSTTNVKGQSPTSTTSNGHNTASPQKGSAASIHLPSLLAACLYLASVVFLSM